MNHARASLVIRNYEEAKGSHRCCGFECLRLIAREFSVKTRTELFAEADETLILLRALPQQCRQWIVLNNADESFVSYVESALRYEAQ